MPLVSRSLLAASASLALVGCTKTEILELQQAELEVSTDLVEFGDLDLGQRFQKTITISNPGDVNLGIRSIELISASAPDNGHRGSFKVEFDEAEMIVPNTADAAERSQVARVDSGHLVPDTAQDTGDTNDPDSGESGDPGPDPGEGDFTAILPPGARLPLHITFSPTVTADNYDAILITTDDEEVPEGQHVSLEEQVYRDANVEEHQIYLHGYSNAPMGNVLVTPRQVDMGFVWPGQSETRYIAIRNIGDGELTVGAISKDPDHCTDGFTIASAPAVDTVLDGYTSSVVEVTYSPTGDSASLAECKVLVQTDDPDSPELDVILRANQGDVASNDCPVVRIHAPEPGTVHVGWGPIPLEVTVFDANQPSSTLTCRVRSALQLGAGLTNCTPDNESGHVWIDVPVDVLTPGLDVLVVQATDDSHCTRTASVPVLINTTWADDDDDGDGFSPSDPKYPDCNDTDRDTYPLAAEVYDGRDNDCDLAVDEGTDGADDDGDGMSEVDGDCNDNDPDTYPGAPEQLDFADNDCDGVIDESTLAFDDDGDGFSELELDCDDYDPNVNPSVDEICGDGIDNNCNALRDDQEACTSVDSEPMLVGQILLSRTSIEEGETVQASVLIYEADGDLVQHTWSVKEEDGGSGTLDDPLGASVNWTAPDSIPSNVEGWVYRLTYEGEDDDGNKVWAFANVSVYPRGQLHRKLIVPVRGSSCATAPVGALGFMGGLGLLVVGFRHRRS